MVFLFEVTDCDLLASPKPPQHSVGKPPKAKMKLLSPAHGGGVARKLLLARNRRVFPSETPSSGFNKHPTFIPGCHDLKSRAARIHVAGKEGKTAPELHSGCTPASLTVTSGLAALTRLTGMMDSLGSLE